MTRPAAPLERLHDLAALVRELQDVMAVKGRDHPDHAVHAGHLRQCRTEREALFQSLAAQRPPAPANIPFTFRRPA